MKLRIKIDSPFVRAVWRALSQREKPASTFIRVDTSPVGDACRNVRSPVDASEASLLTNVESQKLNDGLLATEPGEGPDALAVASSRVLGTTKEDIEWRLAQLRVVEGKFSNDPRRYTDAAALRAVGFFLAGEEEKAMQSVQEWQGRIQSLPASEHSYAIRSARMANSERYPFFGQMIEVEVRRFSNRQSTELRSQIAAVEPPDRRHTVRDWLQAHHIHLPYITL